MTDPLLDGETGVYSRAAWDHLADAEISRAKRYGDALTLALVKVQAAEGIDTTETLIKLARVLTERCRQEDMIGRFTDDTVGILAVTLNGDSDALLRALEQACEDFPVVIAGAPHRLTRPFAATVRDAEAALIVADRAQKRASA